MVQESLAASPYSGKRIVDMVVLAVVALPSMVLAIACAAAVGLTSTGPVLFHQARVGRDGKQFDCLKFRTMVLGDNPLIPDESRITGVGKWLRRFSLDELPQLVNVARAEMSIVGPRPMLPFQAERCDERQRGRFIVRPGLTGWAQINGRNSVGWPERIDLDLEYVTRQSPAFDLRILLRTTGALLAGSGVEGHSADDPFVQQAEASDA